VKIIVHQSGYCSLCVNPSVVNEDITGLNHSFGQLGSAVVLGK